MMVGAMPVGRSYPGAATVAVLVQLEGARAAWKLSLNFFLSYKYFSLLSYFFIAFSFLSRKSNVMVKCVTEVTQRLDVDVEMLISIETHMTDLRFSRGTGPPIPPSGSANEVAMISHV